MLGLGERVPSWRLVDDVAEAQRGDLALLLSLVSDPLRMSRVI